MPYTPPTSRPLRKIGAAMLASGLVLIGSPLASASGPTITFQTGEGQAASGAWLRGSPPLNADASAPSGIRSMRLLVDGQQQQEETFPCDYGYPGVPPCHNRYLSFYFPVTRFADGTHTLTVGAVDGDGASAAASVPLLVDNTPPAPPGDVVVEGGTGWRAQPARRIAWTNPRQQFAPITAVRYRLCLEDADSTDPEVAAQAGSECVEREFAGSELGMMPAGFQPPKPGLWTARIWLVDAAGNSNPDAAAAVTELGYDPTPPQVTGFGAQDPSDPTRVTVAASDDRAPLTGGAIEVRRRGTRAWRPMQTAVDAGGLSARIDDERLRKGEYRVRGTVVNAAGLQQGVDRAADGRPKTLTLPIRRGSRLQAGRRVGKTCHGGGARRRCRYRLRRQVPVEFGRRITLRARLTTQRRPIKNQSLELWQRLSMAGAGWERIGTVQTNARGRMRYTTTRGPARRLRLRYPGTPHVRGDDATIGLHVQARSTLKLSRRNVINGEYMMFRGRVKSLPVPTEGVLVELQVRSRGKWRTFAQPRSDASGAWRYQYRFETVKSGARFRFRARVRRQGGYPYATGSSRPLGVRVHGL